MTYAKCAESWVAEDRGAASPHFDSLKKKIKECARQEAAADLRVGMFEPKWDPDRESCHDLLFLAALQRNVRRGRLKEGGGRLEGQQRSRAGHIRERKGWWDYFSRDLSFRMKWIRNISPLKLSSRAAVCLQQTCKQHVYICTIPLTLVQDVSCICLSWGEYLSMFRPGTNVQLCDQEHLKSMFSSTVTTYRVCLRTHVSTFLSVYGHNLSSGHCCFYSRCPLIYCWLNNHHPASKTVYVV